MRTGSSTTSFGVAGPERVADVTDLAKGAPSRPRSDAARFDLRYQCDQLIQATLTRRPSGKCVLMEIQRSD